MVRMCIHFSSPPPRRVSTSRGSSVNRCTSDQKDAPPAVCCRNRESSKPLCVSNKNSSSISGGWTSEVRKEILINPPSKCSKFAFWMWFFVHEIRRTKGQSKKFSGIFTQFVLLHGLSHLITRYLHSHFPRLIMWLSLGVCEGVVPECVFKCKFWKYNNVHRVLILTPEL